MIEDLRIKYASGPNAAGRSRRQHCNSRVSEGIESTVMSSQVMAILQRELDPIELPGPPQQLEMPSLLVLANLAADLIQRDRGMTTLVRIGADHDHFDTSRVSSGWTHLPRRAHFNRATQAGSYQATIAADERPAEPHIGHKPPACDNHDEGSEETSEPCRTGQASHLREENRCRPQDLVILPQPVVLAFNRLSSACSSEVVPGRDPALMSACTSQRRTVLRPMFSLPATASANAVSEG
jgi:hypothetical protein